MSATRRFGPFAFRTSGTSVLGSSRFIRRSMYDSGLAGVLISSEPAKWMTSIRVRICRGR
jgi:hypothetical protein